MIEVFGFNTTSGKVFEMKNSTVDEIKTKLKEEFPNWSDAAIERAINNQSYYKSVIPYNPNNDNKKSVIKKGSISKEHIEINGCDINPILVLGHNIHTFKNKWEDSEELFKNSNIMSKYNKFETAYDNVVKSIKGVPMASEKTILLNVMKMCDEMGNLKSAICKSDVLQNDYDKDYIKSTGRKLGLNELLNRVDNIPNIMESAIGD